MTDQRDSEDQMNDFFMDLLRQTNARNMTQAATSATTSTNAAPQTLTLEALEKVAAEMQAIAGAQARDFNQLAIDQGFDLNKGDRMIVPKTFDMALVPMRYREQVLPDRFDMMVGDKIMFLKNPNLTLFPFDIPTS